MLTDRGTRQNQAATPPGAATDAPGVQTPLAAPPSPEAGNVVWRYLDSLREKAAAARGGSGLTPADVRALNWAAESVGEPDFFADLTASAET